MLVRDYLTKSIREVDEIVQTPWGFVYGMNKSYRLPWQVHELTEQETKEHKL